LRMYAPAISLLIPVYTPFLDATPAPLIRSRPSLHLTIDCPAVLTTLTDQLRGRCSLSEEQIIDAVSALVEEHIPVSAKADFLIALAEKGETIEEISFFARELLRRAVHPPIDKRLRELEILDVCGTGGDRLNTFNISTTVSFVVAAAGVT